MANGQVEAKPQLIYLQARRSVAGIEDIGDIEGTSLCNGSFKTLIQFHH